MLSLLESFVNAEKRRLVIYFTCPAFFLVFSLNEVKTEKIYQFTDHFRSIFCKAPTVGELQNHNDFIL